MEANKRAYVVVFVIQTIYTGMFLLSKAALNVGMNNFIFTFYRQAVATLFLVPFALFFEWRKAPQLTLKIFWMIFLMSLFGLTLSLDLFGIGLIYTSASMGAAATNCLPVLTFFLAVLLRLEVWKIKTGLGMAKLVGIVMCLGGAITLALYKGPSFKLFSHHHLFANPSLSHPEHLTRAPSSLAWIKGCFILLIGNTFWALWIVMQAQVMKEYPSKLLVTAMSCFLSSIQSFVIAIAVERRPSEWMLGWNVRLVAVAYCGILVTGVGYSLQAFVIQNKGPVFLAMWTPLGLVLTMVCSTFLLGEVITLGSIIGGIMLVGGLYFVLWAKGKEQKILSPNCITVVEADKECLHFKTVEVNKFSPSLV